jgi:hypothetical protein
MHILKSFSLCNYLGITGKTNINFFIQFNLYKEDKSFKNFSENIKKGKEYLKLMDI